MKLHFVIFVPSSSFYLFIIQDVIPVSMRKVNVPGCIIRVQDGCHKKAITKQKFTINPKSNWILRSNPPNGPDNWGTWVQKKKKKQFFFSLIFNSSHEILFTFIFLLGTTDHSIQIQQKKHFLLTSQMINFIHYFHQTYLTPLSFSMF